MCVKIFIPTILEYYTSYICHYFWGEMITVVTVIKDEIFREGLSYLINNSDGFKCLAAFADYDSLIKYYYSSTSNLILFDIDISFDFAISSITEIKNKSKEVVIIALSNNDSDERVFKTVSAGADGFLIKNISHSELIEAIREACTGGAPLSSCAAKRLVEYFHRNGNNFPSNKNYNLSPREKEVISMLVDGKSMREVAQSLFISIDTVRFHSKNIYRKLKVRNQAELVAKTLREKLVQ